MLVWCVYTCIHGMSAFPTTIFPSHISCGRRIQKKPPSSSSSTTTSSSLANESRDYVLGTAAEKGWQSVKQECCAVRSEGSRHLLPPKLVLALPRCAIACGVVGEDAWICWVPAPTSSAKCTAKLSLAPSLPSELAMQRRKPLANDGQGQSPTTYGVITTYGVRSTPIPLYRWLSSLAVDSCHGTEAIPPELDRQAIYYEIRPWTKPNRLSIDPTMYIRVYVPQYFFLQSTRT